jgi:hypothetical protein
MPDKSDEYRGTGRQAVVEPCPKCGYGYADGGYCPECGWVRFDPKCPHCRKEQDRRKMVYA